MRPTRRTLLKSLAAVSATAALPATAEPAGLREPDLDGVPDLHEIRFAQMIVSWDKRTGTLYSIQSAADPLKTNFIGNTSNVHGLKMSETAFTGDIWTTVWHLTNPNWNVEQSGPSVPSGNWQRELTGLSSDIRQVQASSTGMSVAYSGAAENEKGIRSFSLNGTYKSGSDGSLIWEIAVQNTTANLLEFGEFSIPLMMNDHYAEILQRPEIHGVEAEKRRPMVQEKIHQEKVIAHSFVAGHSSYTLVERPAGTRPFLLVHTLGDTPFECVYKADTPFSSSVPAWDGVPMMAISSSAIQESRRWEPWVNGHTSFVLSPGEKRVFSLRFVFVESYDAVRNELANAGNLGIRVLPSMVVQEKTPVHVAIQTREDIQSIDLSSGDGIRLSGRSSNGKNTNLTFAFDTMGQKSVRISYGQRRWTYLHFYCVADIERSLKNRAEFITKRQFFKDPADPFHRYHMFMPYDASKESIFTDSDEVWEVGGSDEFGFSEPLFLAQKLLNFPNLEELAALEGYVEDCLFKYIQNPQNYEVRASLYWKHRTPASPWGHWSEARSEATWRTYNYPHPANIYHALYLIGRRYEIKTRKEPLQYLQMSYQTCLKWFATGEWRHVGLMCGSNAVNILDDLAVEGLGAEHARLETAMRECTQEFVSDPFPYGSELLIDQTAHEQVYFFTKYFGEQKKADRTLEVIQALRGGNQPVWFRYGNDKRGDMACWYSESLNGMALLDGFESNRDPDLLLKGYAGLVSVAANLRADGMGFGWFISTPGIFAHKPPRTLDNGIGQWGFFQGVKAYVVNDEQFGTIGFGCVVEEKGKGLHVTPHDGVRKRVHFCDRGVDIRSLTGEISELELEFDAGSPRLSVRVTDSTGLVKTAQLVIRGLPEGRYFILYGDTHKTQDLRDELIVKAPLDGETVVTISSV